MTNDAIVRFMEKYGILTFVLLFIGLIYVLFNGFPKNPFSESQYMPTCNLDALKAGDHVWVSGKHFVISEFVYYTSLGKARLEANEVTD